MWKFYGKAQFPHGFGWFAWNYAETVLFHKVSTPRWNCGILRRESTEKYVTFSVSLEKVKIIGKSGKEGQKPYLRD